MIRSLLLYSLLFWKNKTSFDSFSRGSGGGSLEMKHNSLVAFVADFQSDDNLLAILHFSECCLKLLDDDTI